MRRVLWIGLVIGLVSVGLIACGKKVKEDATTTDTSLEAGVYKSDNTVMFIYSTTRTDVTNVAIIGDFNNWKKGIDLEYEDGVWKQFLKLDYGLYQYKYIINGTEYIADPAGEASMPDGEGGKNSILEMTKGN